MKFPFNIGLKLHSINTNLVSDAIALWKDGVFQYIELYILPGTYSSTKEIWGDCNIPFIIHAAHSYDGINLASRAQREQNCFQFREVQQFADQLDADTIIVHGGMNGSIEETIDQAIQLSDPRLFIENKPKVAIRGESCVGVYPEELRKVLDSRVFSGFVLDFGHAECAAVSMGIEPFDLIQEFLSFDPKVYHLSDGVRMSERDTHRNFGKGDRKLRNFIKLVPYGLNVTIETPRNPQYGLKDFVNDVKYLESLL